MTPHVARETAVQAAPIVEGIGALGHSLAPATRHAACYIAVRYHQEGNSMQNRCAAQRRHKSKPREPLEKKNQVKMVARFFDHFAAQVTKWAGSPVAFGIALIAIVIWVISGPAFGYSETWQLIINTGTTIVTFLMVFLIQQSQNKDSEALHLKLDELLMAVEGADEGLVDAERLDEDKLLALAAACTARARRQRRQRARSRKSDRH